MSLQMFTALTSGSFSGVPFNSWRHDAIGRSSSHNPFQIRMAPSTVQIFWLKDFPLKYTKIIWSIWYKRYCNLLGVILFPGTIRGCALRSTQIHAACDLNWTFYTFLPGNFPAKWNTEHPFPFASCGTPHLQSSTNVDPNFPVPGHHSIANTKNQLPTRKGWQCRSHVLAVTIVHGWQVTSGMITVERLTTSTDVLGPMVEPE